MATAPIHPLTVEAEAGLQAQRVAGAEAAQAHALVAHQGGRELHRMVIGDGELEAVLTRVPV